MTVEVVTTPRKRLTTRQLLALWEKAQGRCCICGERIDAQKGWVDSQKGPKGFIDEHKRALVLGGSNDLANRGPAHLWCAGVKTKDDVARGNKAKDQKAIAVNAKRPAGKLRGRGFSPAEKQRFDGREPANGMPEIARRFSI